MKFDLDTYISHHLENSHEWHLPFLPPIHLPEFLSVHQLMMLICAFFLILLFGILYKKSIEAPRGLTNLLEAFVVFVRDEIAIANLGHDVGLKMTPLFCTFFFFILGLNLMGMVPIFSTATSNVSVTGGLALVTLTFMICGSIYINGIMGFINVFIPKGVPIPILFLLTPIEFLGLFIKTFALMIRLFANMLAGHIVILSIIGLVIQYGLVAMPAIALAVFISLLEVFIAFLQAYIFTLLSAMFIGQTLHAEH